MIESAALEYAFTREYRLRDAEKLVGLTTRQILHVGEKKLRFEDWNTGKGNARKLSMLELFQLRLIAAVDQRVPIKAMQNLADLGEVYFRGALGSTKLRTKPAAVVGYPSASGGWWWLLGFDGRWPENPPAPDGSGMLIVVAIRSVLGQLMQGICDQLRRDIAEGVSAADFQASLSDDLHFAATAPVAAAA